MSKHTHTYLRNHQFQTQREHAKHVASGQGLSDMQTYYINQFEKDAKEYLSGSERKDEGWRMLYTRDGEEIAYFNYEELTGSVYAKGGTTAPNRRHKPDLGPWL
jgi:hypothetical protein